jgi:GDP-L-fucose synthase
MYDSPIYVAGHNGLVGSAIVRRLRAEGAKHLLLRTRAELDLRRQAEVERFFAEQRPQFVFLAAAKVGGIEANRSEPAQFLGSSCIYPRLAPQPMSEDCLLTGALEPTNEWYAIAKIAGLKMCQAYRRELHFDAISAMPTNLYGPGDNFSLSDSHVLPALMRKCHEATLQHATAVEVWGTGEPRREFLHVDDLADACIYLMRQYSDEAPLNVGWGEDISIAELARMVAQAVGFKGELRYERGKPDGTPRKLLDTSRLTALGWRPKIALQDGLVSTYEWFCAHQGQLRR